MKILISLFGLIFLTANSALADTQIWLSPLSSVTEDKKGESDFMAMVPADAPWATVAKHTTAFKLYPFFVGRASDADLKAIIEGMKQRHIALAFEGRVLTTVHSCKMRDGGDGGQATVHLLDRIKKLGGEVAYFAMDEPLKHATQGESRCHAKLADAAHDMANQIRAFRSVFPNMAVGDVEPIGAWPNAPSLAADTMAWVHAYQDAMGQPMAFFHADVGWTTNWLEITSKIQSALAAAHVPFGIIYNGTDLAGSSEEWTRQATDHFRVFEDGARPPPATAIFQSWVRYPEAALPETSPNTLTGVARAYLQYRHLDK